MDLLGGLLSLAFFTRICVYGVRSTLERVTSCYLALFAAVAIGCSLGVLSSDMLALDGQLVTEERQFWRPVTALFWHDGLGLGFALQLWQQQLNCAQRLQHLN